MTKLSPDRPFYSTYSDARGSFNKYRSIAYGTWKPGEARRFSDKSRRRLHSEAPVTTLSYDKNEKLIEDQFIRQKSELSLSLESKTLVPTEDEVSEIEQ